MQQMIGYLFQLHLTLPELLLYFPVLIVVKWPLQIWMVQNWLVLDFILKFHHKLFNNKVLINQKFICLRNDRNPFSRFGNWQTGLKNQTPHYRCALIRFLFSRKNRFTTLYILTSLSGNGKFLNQSKICETWASLFDN